jgi:Methyltransferase domain
LKEKAEKKINQTNFPFRLSMLWTPERYTQESAWFEHGPFAFWIVDTLRPKSIVELGTHSGFSYFCFCQAVATLRTNSQCFAVDTWKGDEHAGFYGDEIYDSVVQHNERYKMFSTLTRSKFEDALDKFPAKSIDLLHIDGRHFYDDVKSDYESWLPKLKDDAVVLFHDTQVRERRFGVWKMFGELKQNHSAFDFLHGHGLGVLVPNKMPKALESFFIANSSDIQTVFSSLGSAISTKWLLHDANLKLQQIVLNSVQMDKFIQDNKTKEAELRLLKLENLKLRNERNELLERIVQSLPVSKPEQFDQAPVVDVIAKLRNEIYHQRPVFSRIKTAFYSVVNPSKVMLTTLRKSIYFDPKWYLKTYPDVENAGIDPALHYLEYGAKEGRDPGPYFSTCDYQKKHPETSGVGQNPLLHQLRHE